MKNQEQHGFRQFSSKKHEDGTYSIEAHGYYLGKKRDGYYIEFADKNGTQLHIGISQDEIMYSMGRPHNVATLRKLEDRFYSEFFKYGSDSSYDSYENKPMINFDGKSLLEIAMGYNTDLEASQRYSKPADVAKTESEQYKKNNIRSKGKGRF